MPLVVTLHGRGLDEHSMNDLVAALPPGVAAASVRGLLPTRRGFGWYTEFGIGRPHPESIAAATKELLAWLDDLRVDHPRVVLCGFSSGMVLAGALLLAEPARFAGAVLLSGCLPADAGMPMEDGRLSGVPVFWGSDADNDPIIPPELIEWTGAWLRDASGAKLVERRYPGLGHGRSPEELADVSAFVAQVL